MAQTTLHQDRKALQQGGSREGSMETWNTEQWRKAEAEAAQQAINYYESSQSAEVRQDFYDANLLHARAAHAQRFGQRSLTKLTRHLSGCLTRPKREPDRSRPPGLAVLALMRRG